MLTSIINQSKQFLQKWKTMIITLIILAIIVSGGVGLFKYQTEANGIVKQINTNSIVISNKLFERTIALNNANVDLAKINIGEKVKVVRNIQGDVLSINTKSDRVNNHNDRKTHNEQQGCQTSYRFQ